ncbi:hypothetical protein M514_07098, partial [Trichuris suis]
TTSEEDPLQQQEAETDEAPEGNEDAIEGDAGLEEDAREEKATTAKPTGKAQPGKGTPSDKATKAKGKSKVTGMAKKFAGMVKTSTKKAMKVTKQTATAAKNKFAKKK